MLFAVKRPLSLLNDRFRFPYKQGENASAVGRREYTPAAAVSMLWEELLCCVGNTWHAALESVLLYSYDYNSLQKIILSLTSILFTFLIQALTCILSHSSLVEFATCVCIISTLLWLELFFCVMEMSVMTGGAWRTDRPTSATGDRGEPLLLSSPPSTHRNIFSNEKSLTVLSWIQSEETHHGVMEHCSNMVEYCVNTARQIEHTIKKKTAQPTSLLPKDFIHLSIGTSIQLCLRLK